MKQNAFINKLNLVNFFIKYSEHFFLIMCGFFIVCVAWNGLFQPLYWDSLGSLFSQSQRISIAMDQLFSLPRESNSLRLLTESLINKESDYPHTFAMSLFYSLSFVFSPKINFIIMHFASLGISLASMVVFYIIIRKMISIKSAISYTMLMITNPLFLAQTVLVYHEIPGMLLKFLSIHYLLQRNHRLFLFSAVLAFLIRFENGIILLFFSLLELFLNRKSIDKIVFNKFMMNLLLLSLIIISWLLFHRTMTGWFFISPDFSHAISRFQALMNFSNYIFFQQGRFIISLLILVLFITQLHLIKKKWKSILLILVLLSFSLLSVVYIGNWLPRYILSFIPVFYFLPIYFMNQIRNRINKYIFILIFFLMAVVQFSYIKECKGNYESCMKFIDWIDLKRDIGHVLEKYIKIQDTVYMNWDESIEYKRDYFEHHWFCKECFNTQYYIDSIKNIDKVAYKSENNNSYFLVTPNTKEYFAWKSMKVKTKLIINFSKNDVQAELFLLEK